MPSSIVTETTIPVANLSHYVTDQSSSVLNGPVESTVNDASAQLERCSVVISFHGAWYVLETIEAIMLQ